MSYHDNNPSNGLTTTTSTTAPSDPDAIRTEIERTRGELSRDVNALGEAVSPGSIAKHQTSKVGNKVKGAFVGAKDRVMGSAYDVQESASDAASAVSDTASDAGERTSEVAHAVKRKAEGNPLAAGLIALGAGWLLGSLLPATQREQQLAAATKEKAQPLVQEVQGIAQESAEHLKEPARESVEQVKETAQDAVQSVKAEGQSAAAEVKDSAIDAKDAVQEQRPTG
jgi:ElaB/YqjD/DUF883 family membrane-anchored ribosome-binding protein